jgi:transmembrane sensor
MSEPEPPASEGLFEEAAAWFARMRGPQAESSRGAFEAWLSLGALHRSAYNRAAEIFALGKLLADEGVPLTRPRDDAGYRQGVRMAAGAAAFLLFLTCSWILTRADQHLPENPLPSAPIETGMAGHLTRIAASGVPRSERLADGSVIRLRGSTSISVELTRAMRALTLERGSARFFVAHEPRPFLVFAGGGYVAARGTVFDVGLGADRRVTVRLVEGVVDVSPPIAAGATPQPRRLRAGQSMSFEAVPAPGEPVPPAYRAGPLERSREARSGTALTFESVTLAELVRLANRGSGRPIRIADPATGRLLVSGTFRVDDTSLLAERLASLLGLAADPRTHEIVLRRR